MGFLSFCLGCQNDSKNSAQTTYETIVNFQTGDLVLRRGDGVFSDGFRKLANVKEKIYSHVGVVNIEPDSIVVYHAEASEFTGVGFVKKENINRFLKNMETYGVYRIDCENAVKQKIIEKLDAYLSLKTPFDLKFDITNDDKVYCSELVANAINYAFNDSIITPKIQFRNDLIYGIDDIYLNDGFQKIYQKIDSEIE